MPPLAVVLNIHPKFFVCSVEQAHNVHTRRVSGPRESQMTHHPQHVPKSLRPIAESHHSWVQPRPIDMSGGLGLFPCYLLVRVLPRRTYLSLDGPGRHALSRPSQLFMRQVDPGGGIYAPTLRYWKGRFYLATCCVIRRGTSDVSVATPCAVPARTMCAEAHGPMYPMYLLYFA
jgi:hypothetical protein